MNCPHCGKEIEQQPMIPMLNPAAANGVSFKIDFNNAACANAYPAQAVNVQNLTLNAAANGCNPFPHLTYIKF